MRVLLDTNVILNGTFNRFTEARALRNTVGVLSFFASETTFTEIHRLIERNCYSDREKNAAKKLIEKYLRVLGCLILPPGDPLLSKEILDPDDRSIASTAKENQIDTICTYNINDFLRFDGQIKTPQELSREYALASKINSFFKISSPSIGTLFAVIEPYHQSSIGDVFTTTSGFEYFFDKKGFFRSTNLDQMIVSKNPVTINSRIGLIVRNKSDFFEVSVWTPNENSEWTHGTKFKKKIIAFSKTGLLEEIKIKLCTNTGKRKYYGHMMNISATNNFIKESHLHKALSAMCLDVIYGSQNLRKLIDSMMIMS